MGRSRRRQVRRAAPSFHKYLSYIRRIPVSCLVDSMILLTKQYLSFQIHDQINIANAASGRKVQQCPLILPSSTCSPCRFPALNAHQLAQLPSSSLPNAFAFSLLYFSKNVDPLESFLPNVGLCVHDHTVLSFGHNPTLNKCRSNDWWSVEQSDSAKGGRS